MIKFIMIYLCLFSFLFGYEKYTDEKNVYFESDNFRVIAGKSYEYSSSVEALASKYLQAADEVWQKEIVELGFKVPRNSETKKIDIYIGNRSAYNYDAADTESNIMTISSEYAGWATLYPSDNTPYFLLNPDMSDEVLKVTIAHEFFHTIQYAYFDISSANANSNNDEWWINSVWWFEATATLMEDEVYDDTNDYVNFLRSFFNASYKSFETFDGSHEYSMVIFAKYIKEKFGMDFIKKSFERLETIQSEGFFETLDIILKTDYDTNINNELSEFSFWVNNPSKYFEEGSLYPVLKRYTNDETIPSFEKGGIVSLENLNSGWNMVALPNIDISKVQINDLISIWEYDNNTWKNNVSTSGYEQINDLNISNGYWVQVTNNSNIPYTYTDISSLDMNSLSSEWNLLGTSKNIDTSMFTDVHLIWQYKDDKWYIYSSNSDLQNKAIELGYGELTQITPYTSFWLYK